MSLDNMRDIDGSLSRYVWPGGYPLYYIDNESNVLCPDCANDPWMSTYPVLYDVNYEDINLRCDDCSELIESAYGEKD